MPLVQRLLLILFFLLPSVSHSAVLWNESNGGRPTPIEACQSRNGFSASWGVLTVSFNAAGDVGDCNFDGALGYHIYRQGSCDAPTVFNATTGVCDTPPASCTDGTPDGPQNAASEVPVTPQVGCHNGCEVLWNPDGAPYIGCGESGGIGSCYYYQSGGYKQTGATCSGSDAAPAPSKPKPPKPNPCPVCDCLDAGKSWGTVNGAIVCVTRGTAGSAPVKTQAPPIATTTTPAPTPSNPNPAPVTTYTPQPIITITPPPAGSPASTPPTVTVGGTNADGSTTDTSSDKDTFCTSNPNSPLCKAKSACESDPEGASCKFLCEKYPNSVGCKDASDFIGSGSGDDGVGVPTKTVDPDAFSAVSMPSNNSCPQSITIPNHGHPITISFDWLCQYASAFKGLVIAFSLFAAAVMVTGAVRADSQPYQRGLF
ncbi:MAG TPA: virulence factor TspB C-terminal domain-related protein [Methylophilaceae bacterium]|jgi:hypothetical protein